MAVRRPNSWLLALLALAVITSTITIGSHFHFFHVAITLKRLLPLAHLSQLVPIGGRAMMRHTAAASDRTAEGTCTFGGGAQRDCFGWFNYADFNHDVAKGPDPDFCACCAACRPQEHGHFYPCKEKCGGTPPATTGEADLTALVDDAAAAAAAAEQRKRRGDRHLPLAPSTAGDVREAITALEEGSAAAPAAPAAPAASAASKQAFAPVGARPPAISGDRDPEAPHVPRLAGKLRWAVRRPNRHTIFLDLAEAPREPDGRLATADARDIAEAVDAFLAPRAGFRVAFEDVGAGRWVLRAPAHAALQRVYRDLDRVQFERNRCDPGHQGERARGGRPNAWAAPFDGAPPILTKLSCSGWRHDLARIIDGFGVSLVRVDGKADPARDWPKHTATLVYRPTSCKPGKHLSWHYAHGACKWNDTSCYFLDHSPCYHALPRVVRLYEQVEHGKHRRAYDREVDAGRKHMKRALVAMQPKNARGGGWWYRSASGRGVGISASYLATYPLYEYFLRPRHWLRHAVDQRVALLDPPLPAPCAVFHVRRTDATLRNIHFFRRVIPVSEYLRDAGEALRARRIRDVLLLTDDQTAIDEVERMRAEQGSEAAALTWHWLPRKRHVGSQGGWENPFPSGSPQEETEWIHTAFRLVQQCDVFVGPDEGGFTDLLVQTMCWRPDAWRLRAMGNVPLVRDGGGPGGGGAQKKNELGPPAPVPRRLQSKEPARRLLSRRHPQSSGGAAGGEGDAWWSAGPLPPIAPDGAPNCPETFRLRARLYTSRPDPKTGRKRRNVDLAELIRVSTPVAHAKQLWDPGRPGAGRKREGTAVLVHNRVCDRDADRRNEKRTDPCTRRFASRRDVTGTNARAIRWKGQDTCHRFRCCDASVHPDGCYFIGRVRALQNFAVDRHEHAKASRARAHVRTVALFAEVTDGDLQNIPEGDNGFFVNLQWPDPGTAAEDAETHMLLNTWDAIAPGHGVWMIAA